VIFLQSLQDVNNRVHWVSEWRSSSVLPRFGPPLPQPVAEGVALLLSRFCIAHRQLCHELGLSVCQIYWRLGGELQRERQYAHAQFLEAARIDPGLAGAFTYLGRYYLEVQKDDLRARRCFQKAVQLDPNDERAGDPPCTPSLWQKWSLAQEHGGVACVLLGSAKESWSFRMTRVHIEPLSPDTKAYLVFKMKALVNEHRVAGQACQLQ
jgi:tetratricopeptide (TPR) repeat protein